MLLAGLQAAIIAASLRWRRISALVKAEPALLLLCGRLLERALRHECVTREALFAAVRADGHAGIDGLYAVVLQTEGSLSVVASAPALDARAIDAVRGEAD